MFSLIGLTSVVTRLKLYGLTAGLFFFFLHTAIGQHQLIKFWETDTLLKVPESVLYDAQENLLYVSNVDGTEPWEKDEKGSIATINLNGKIIAAEWVAGLNAPKGMAKYGDDLYVADIDRIVVINVKRAAITKVIPVPGAQTLNDIVTDNQGTLYVSDTRGKKIYKVGGNITTVLLDSTALKSPNGLHWYNNTLYVLDAGSLYKMGKDQSFLKLAEGMEGGTDGIVQVTNNEFIISCWAGSIWYVNDTDGSKELLLAARENGPNAADMGYNTAKRMVYVPTFFSNTVVAYLIK
jgi:hypothetical protein